MTDDIVDELRAWRIVERPGLLEDAAERISALRITVVRQRERITDMEIVVDNMRRQLRAMQRRFCEAMHPNDEHEAKAVAMRQGWDCFNATDCRQPDATTDKTSQEAT